MTAEPLKTLAEMFDMGRLTFRPIAPHDSKETETWPLVHVIYGHPGAWSVFRQMDADDTFTLEARVTDERLLPGIVAALLGQPMELADDSQHD
jgi:hypothetical protein